MIKTQVTVRDTAKKVQSRGVKVLSYLHTTRMQYSQTVSCL